MYELKKMEKYLRTNLFGPGPRLIIKNLTGRGLTKVEKHWDKVKQVQDMDQQQDRNFRAS